MDTPGEDLTECWDAIARRDQTIVQVLKDRMSLHCDGDELEDIWVHAISDQGVVVGEVVVEASVEGSGVVLRPKPFCIKGSQSCRVTNYSVVLKDPNWLTLHTGWLMTPKDIHPWDTIYLNAIYFDLCEW